jgi:hypothetical protein
LKSCCAGQGVGAAYESRPAAALKTNGNRMRQGVVFLGETRCCPNFMIWSQDHAI